MDINTNHSFTNLSVNSYHNEDAFFVHETYFSLLFLGLSIIGRKLNTPKPVPSPKRVRNFYVSIFNCICYVLLYSLVPFLLVLLIFLASLKQIVKLLLKIQNGPFYGGFLDSADVFWATADISKPIITVVTIVDIKTNSFNNFVEDLRRAVDEKIFNRSNDFRKLTCIHSSKLGYSYLIKNKLQVEDCVNPVDPTDHATIDYSLLQQILSKFSNKPLPKSNKALWEMLIFSKPLELFRTNREQPNNCYVVLSRFNHIVGDGLSLTHLLAHIFAANEISFPLYLDNMKLPVPQPKTFIKMVKDRLNEYCVYLVAPAILLYQNVLRNSDRNALHGPVLSGEKIMVYGSEKSQLMVSIIKEIKAAVPGVTFTDVVLTGVSASLESFFTRNSEEISYSATTILTSLIRKPNANKSPILQNQFSVGLIDLPVASDSKSMLQKLTKIQKKRDALKKSADNKVNYILLSYICGLIPEYILKQLIRVDKITMTTSNMAGLPKISILDGCEVEDTIFFLPLRGKAGLGFSFLTYDGRLQLGLSIDKSIISSTQVAQSLIDNIFEKIMSLYIEIFGSIDPTKIDRDQ